MTKSLPPMTDLFEMAGLSMPDLVKAKKLEENKNETAKVPENADKTVETK